MKFSKNKVRTLVGFTFICILLSLIAFIVLFSDKKWDDTEYISLSGYTLVKESSTSNLIRYQFDSKGVSILVAKFSNLSIDEWNDWINYKFSLFTSLFDEQPPSYPGQFTTAIECPKEFFPKYKELKYTHGFFKYYIAFANGNFVYGLCSRDLIKYYSVYGYLMCDANYYEIKFYVPLTKDANKTINRFINNISC